MPFNITYYLSLFDLNETGSSRNQEERSFAEPTRTGTTRLIQKKGVKKQEIVHTNDVNVVNEEEEDETQVSSNTFRKFQSTPASRPLNSTSPSPEPWSSPILRLNPIGSCTTTWIGKTKRTIRLINSSCTLPSRGTTLILPPTSTRYRRRFSTSARPSLNRSNDRRNRRNRDLARTWRQSNRPCATSSTTRAGRSRPFILPLRNGEQPLVLPLLIIFAARSRSGRFGTPTSRSLRRRTRTMRREATIRRRSSNHKPTLDGTLRPSSVA